MSRTDLDLRDVDFITIGTIGPKGKRVFHLQAGQGNQIVSFTIEKEQAWALAEAIRQFIDDIDERNNTVTEVEMAALDMDLREPIQPLFRVAQMGLAYEEDTQRIILIAQEMAAVDAEDGEEAARTSAEEPGIVRMWTTLQQMRALSIHAIDTVEQGRPNPRQNGRITYYWT
jgi:uncharacterized repeat protein (TIGR03847 family)